MVFVDAMIAVLEGSKGFYLDTERGVYSMSPHWGPHRDFERQAIGFHFAPHIGYGTFDLDGIVFDFFFTNDWQEVQP